MIKIEQFVSAKTQTIQTCAFYNMAYWNIGFKYSQFFCFKILCTRFEDFVRSRCHLWNVEFNNSNICLTFFNSTHHNFLCLVQFLSTDYAEKVKNFFESLVVDEPFAIRIFGFYSSFFCKTNNSVSAKQNRIPLSISCAGNSDRWTLPQRAHNDCCSLK